MVVRVSVDQYMLYAYFLTRRPNSGSAGSGYTNLSAPKPKSTKQTKTLGKGSLNRIQTLSNECLKEVNLRSIRSQTNGFGEGVVEACIPVDDDQDVHDQVGDAKSVWVVGSGLCALEELHHPETKTHEPLSGFWFERFAVFSVFWKCSGIGL